MTYQPKTINTDRVELPREISELMEQLAENTHEVWALRRIAQGWKWGPERSDDRKEHPCLVPYAQLPDAEKEYDRATAEQTLKAILTLGYRIEKVDSNTQRS